ncbi:MAG: hypothetical protein IIA45_05965 [Bacteroidetes bacterium]|nr:hypothetical protein [Bacteroidota bacterium]
MKFKWFILLLLSFYLTSDQAFSQQTFQRAYGGSGNDYGKSVIQIYDGNYLIVGETTSSGAGVRDVFVMKIDTAGNLLWSNTYGGTGDEDLASGDLLQTADSGFIILGRTKSFGASGWDIYCVKLDSVGTIVWENRYGGNVTDNGDGIYPTHDGGYIITSSQTSYTVGSNDISLLKIDGSGNLKWTKTYGASSADHPGKIRRTSDSGFFIVGNTLSFGLGSRVAFLIRIDSLGNKLWHKVYNGGQDEGLMTLELTLDGGVIMLGSTKSGGAGNWDMFLIKADSAGNVLWAKSYGGSGIDRGIRIITEPNGDYTIAGHSESVGNGSRDLILMRIDSVGTAIWTRAYGTSQFEEAGW